MIILINVLTVIGLISLLMSMYALYNYTIDCIIEKYTIGAAFSLLFLAGTLTAFLRILGVLLW